MDDRFEYCMSAEIRHARAKFPNNNLQLAALMEEVGELSKALLDHSFGKADAKDVFAEAVQVAAMAYRVAMEGSTEFPYKFDHSHYQAFDVNKQVKPKAAALKPDSKPKNQISAGFLRRVQAAGCQCERQKLEGKPLCGICYSRLPADLQKALREKKGGELEAAYEQACEVLKRRNR